LQIAFLFLSPTACKLKFQEKRRLGLEEMTEKKAKIVKSAPNSKESEMMVLGCMLTSVNSLNVAADSLAEEDFYFLEHQIIFKSLKEAYLQDKPADIHLIAEDLKKKELLEKVGGVNYITTLAQYAGTSAYIEEYVGIVRNKSIFRRLIQAAQQIESTALLEQGDVASLLDDAQGMLFNISQTASSKQGISLRDLLSGMKAESKLPYLKQLEMRQEEFHSKGENDPLVTGVPTHFLDLDKMLNGLNPSNLIILAARPSMGKTAFAINIAENVAFKSKVPVAVFSLEMTADELLHRMICSQAEVESDKIRLGSLNGLEYQRVVAAVNHMKAHQIIIDDQPGLKITDLRARARRLKEIYNIKLIVIDYMQLLSGPKANYNSDNRQNEISEISRMLKNLARELNIPIICLSQLSRKVEERAGHRPMLSDLRESGCLAKETIIKNHQSGTLHTIEELALRKEQTPITVLGLDENHNISPQLMTKVFFSGKKMLYVLKLKSGKTIRASSNHPFMKISGWTKLENLKVHDKIATFSHGIKEHADFVPKEIWHTHIEKALKSNQSTWEELLEILPEFKDQKRFDTHDLKKTELREIANFLDDLTLLNLANSPAIWDEITSIEEDGIEDVYDATVERVHNFIANDIIVHNSIEQDADIVMFLFRPEYYNPANKPGLAEVIVAKNRHGKVGNVNLTYRKAIAQFQNSSNAPTEDVSLNQDSAFSAFSPQ
jgi:replicative DNA helicase